MCKTALKWSTVVPERCQIYKSPDGGKCVCLVQMSHWRFRENENCDAKIPCQIKGIKFCTTPRSTFSLVALIPHYFTKYILKAKWKTWSPQEQAQVLGINPSKSVSAEGQIWREINYQRLDQILTNEVWNEESKLSTDLFFTTSPQFLLSQLPNVIL